MTFSRALALSFALFLGCGPKDAGFDPGTQSRSDELWWPVLNGSWTSECFELNAGWHSQWQLDITNGWTTYRVYNFGASCEEQPSIVSKSVALITTEGPSATLPGAQNIRYEFGSRTDLPLRQAGANLLNFFGQCGRRDWRVGETSDLFADPACDTPGGLPWSYKPGADVYDVLRVSNADGGTYTPDGGPPFFFNATVLELGNRLTSGNGSTPADRPTAFLPVKFRRELPWFCGGDATCPLDGWSSQTAFDAPPGARIESVLRTRTNDIVVLALGSWELSSGVWMAAFTPTGERRWLRALPLQAVAAKATYLPPADSVYVLSSTGTTNTLTSYVDGALASEVQLAATGVVKEMVTASEFGMYAVLLDGTTTRVVQFIGSSVSAERVLPDFTAVTAATGGMNGVVAIGRTGPGSAEAMRLGSGLFTSWRRAVPANATEWRIAGARDGGYALAGAMDGGIYTAFLFETGDAGFQTMLPEGSLDTLHIQRNGEVLVTGKKGVWPGGGACFSTRIKRPGIVTEVTSNAGSCGYRDNSKAVALADDSYVLTTNAISNGQTAYAWRYNADGKLLSHVPDRDEISGCAGSGYAGCVPVAADAGPGSFAAQCSPGPTLGPCTPLNQSHSIFRCATHTCVVREDRGNFVLDCCL